MRVGTVVSTTIKKNRDGESPVRLAQTAITDASDNQTVEIYSQSGEEFVPQPGTDLYVAEAGSAWKISVACDDHVEPDSSLTPGEREMYSYDQSRARLAKIRLKSNGNVVLNDGGGLAVEHGRLKLAFDQLKQDLNLFMLEYNKLLVYLNATLLIAGTPTPAIPALPAVPSVADMSTSKSEKVEVP